jgi:hypothetical protein
MAGANTGSAGTQQNPKSVSMTGANTGSAGNQQKPKPVKHVKNKKADKK